MAMVITQDRREQAERKFANEERAELREARERYLFRFAFHIGV